MAGLSALALAALVKVLGEGYEIKELWSENEEYYPLWMEGITQLVQRLEQYL